ncbi:hypothetical protein LJC43_02725 [Parabacteroides sp. OttesenSCG-928-G21]|nr:hypothetical protein [Parabacteroides sp. OttesenSCG-928-G21]
MRIVWIISVLLLLTGGCRVVRQQEVKKAEKVVVDASQQDSLSLDRVFEELRARKLLLEHIHFRMPDSMSRVYPASVTRIALQEDKKLTDSVVVNNKRFSSGQSVQEEVEETYRKIVVKQRWFSVLRGIMVLLFLLGIIKIVNRYIKIRN